MNEQAPPAEGLGPDVPPSADTPDPRPPSGRRRRRRSWKRTLANLLIVAGVLLAAYPVGTWGYTWWEQRNLEQKFVQANPQLAQSDVRLLQGDFIPVEEEMQQIRERDQEVLRQAALQAFRDAADAFALSVSGKSGEPIGRVVIPKIKVDVVMIEGTGRGDLREGPGHWPETPFPGQGGNFVVSGHRTTYGAPFLRLDKLAPGDEIDLVLPYVAARYEVTEVLIVKPDEVEVVGQADIEQVSLAACHPIYSARERIVVKGDLVEFKLVEASEERGS